MKQSRDIPPLVKAVRQRIGERIARLTERFGGTLEAATLLPGKCLRTLLAGRLWAAEGRWQSEEKLQGLCVATELVHTASLCHDDVVDGAHVRRAAPTLWRKSGASAAILIGDLLLCDAMELLLEIDDGRYVPTFLAKVREMVEAETEQELQIRGKAVDAATCLRVARGKTGALFAFVAGSCGGEQSALVASLEEAGYRVGTAYQLADDLLDVAGNPRAAGKTLGTDRRRGACTLPQTGGDGVERTTRQIQALRDSAPAGLEAYPGMQAGLAEFFAEDLEAILNQYAPIEPLCKEPAV